MNAWPTHKPKTVARYRTGMAVLLVLVMVAMALAVAFSTSRVQTTALFIDRNQRLRGDARAAALAGISRALRTMHTNSWNGVGSTFTDSLADGTSYQVTFQAGDSQLTPSDPEYERLPYRVTVTSVGRAVDPSDSRVQSSHTITVVAELAPQATSDWPSGWSVVQAHEIYQWGDLPVEVNLPVQWSGSIWTQGTVSFAPDYPRDDGHLFYGHIDEVAVFNNALSDTNLLAIHNLSLVPGANVAQAILDYNPVAYWRLDEPSGATVAADTRGFQPGRYFGAKPGQAQVPFSTSKGSAYFDGINDAIDCGNFDIIGSQVSLLCWCRIQQVPRLDDMYLVGKALNDDPEQQLWSLFLDAKEQSGSWKLKAIVTTTSGTKTVTGGTLTSGLWYFVAMVYDGSRIRLFVNGVPVAHVTHSGSLVANSQARIFIGDNAPGSARARLLRDYWAMAQNGAGDWRSVIGTWKAPSGKLANETIALLKDDLRVAVENISVNTSPPVSIGSPITSYRLYPGGPSYTVPVIGSVIANINLAPDPQSNPLGLFRTSGSLEIRDNVTIRGTILTDSSGSVNLTGKSIAWEPVLLPTLDGQSTPYRLPAVVTPNDFWIRAGSKSGRIRGALVVGKEFRLYQANDTDASCQILGRVVAQQITCRNRTNWPTWISTWQAYSRDFLSQTQIAYFPVWLQEYRSLQPDPQLTIQPDPGRYIDHWPAWSQPVFVVPSGKSGLRWRVIRWSES